MFARGIVAPDPAGIVTSGHENKTAPTAAIRKGETINADALTELFKTIIANNPGRRLAQAQKRGLSQLVESSRGWRTG